MTGFDNETLAFLLKRYREDQPEKDAAQAEKVFSLALAYDLDYMGKAGIIRDGTFTDEYYDDDDAYDFIIEHIAKALQMDDFELSELLEAYFDYHDEFMNESGLLHWE